MSNDDIDLGEERLLAYVDGQLEAAEEARLFEAAGLFGKLDGEDEEGYSFRIKESFSGLCPMIDVVQSTGRDTSWLRSQIELYKPDVTMWDSAYRQYAAGTKKGDNNGDWKALTAVSRDIKDITMETATRSIVTHQLNRGAQKTVGDLSNMALSDAIGQDADMIIRVVTGKQEGTDVSALVLLAAREISINGIMINSVLSSDFSEIGAITSMKAVEALMQADDAEEGEEGAGKQPPRRGGKKGQGLPSMEKRDAFLSKGKKTEEAADEVVDVHEAYGEQDQDVEIVE